tara:strand:- start:987 stop:1145 length:159 start_codon:yes stop_codon:yes gene_type:complete
MKLLSSRKFSLVCAVVNGVWAFNSLIIGSYGFAAVAIFFCGGCAINYMREEK